MNIQLGNKSVSVALKEIFMALVICWTKEEGLLTTAGCCIVLPMATFYTCVGHGQLLLLYFRRKAEGPQIVYK